MKKETTLVLPPSEADQRLTHEGNLLGKALEIHEISLKQGLNQALETKKTERAVLVEKASEINKRLVALVNKEISFDYCCKMPKIVEFAGALTGMLGKKKPITCAQIIFSEGDDDYSGDNFKAMHCSDYWFFDRYDGYPYGYRYGFKPNAKGVAKLFNIEAKTYRLMLNLNVALLTAAEDADKDYDVTDGTNIYVEVSVSDAVIDLVKEIKELLPLITAYDPQIEDLIKKIGSVKDQAEAMKVKAFRAQLGKYQGGSDIIAMLDQSIKDTIEGVKTDLVELE